MRVSRMPLALALAVLAASGCSQRSKLEDQVESLARFSGTSTSREFQLATCGWSPPAAPAFTVERAKLDEPSGDEAHGSVAMDLVLRSKEGTSFTCEGRIVGTYTWHKGSPGKGRPHYGLRDLRRLGPKSPVLVEVEKRATTLELDREVTTTLGEGWKLPDGSFAVAYRVQIVEPGLHAITGLSGPSYTDSLVVFQKGAAVEEGNGKGTLREWDLVPGEALLLYARTNAEQARLRFHLGKR